MGYLVDYKSQKEITKSLYLKNLHSSKKNEKELIIRKQTKGGNHEEKQFYQKYRNYTQHFNYGKCSVGS